MKGLNKLSDGFPNCFAVMSHIIGREGRNSDYDMCISVSIYREKDFYTENAAEE